MGTRVPGYPHLKLMGTQVSLPGPGYIIPNIAVLWNSGIFCLKKVSISRHLSKARFRRVLQKLTILG